MSLDKHPDLLRRQQLIGTAEEEEWEEYQHLLGEFEKGIRYVLRRDAPTEVMHDLVSECFALYIQTCGCIPRRDGQGEWFPQSYGKDVANHWLTKHFKQVKLPTSEDETEKWEPKSPTVGGLERQNDEGEYNIASEVSDDPALEPEGWMGKEKPHEPYMPKTYSIFRATADYELCLRYMERNGKPGNRFTRAESSAYENALRRLKKVAK
jgi:hypothetical protein